MNSDAEKQVEAMNAALAVIVNHIGHITVLSMD
ncbi:DUF2783 domain-containing protein [Ferrimonas sp. SCSIO 43195]|nr:DUF2783 domain-containing protein [Ferrimonas sp. SCSIO 43195]